MPKFKPLKLPDYPDLVKYNIPNEDRLAYQYDRFAYQRSDADFAKRHQPIVDAEKLFEQQTLKDQQGDSELMPALQNEFTRAGLQGALSAFGSTPGTLTPGSAGEADVARNLGLSIAGFQDRNRQNRIQSLTTAEQLFPRRQFGLTGHDAVNLDVSNINNENSWNQAKNAQDVQLATYNATGQVQQQNAQTQQGNINAQAGAVGQSSLGQGIGSAASIIAKLGASYGARTPAVPSYSGWKPTAATSGGYTGGYAGGV